VPGYLRYVELSESAYNFYITNFLPFGVLEMREKMVRHGWQGQT
jgi:hypothetical protein